MEERERGRDTEKDRKIEAERHEERENDSGMGERGRDTEKDRKRRADRVGET